MFLLDSNVFIYYLNDDLTEDGNRLFERAIASGSAYSAISRLEVLGYPLSAPKRQDAEDILRLFQELPIDDAILDQAIALRSSSRIKSIDALIAATARHHNLPLITRNLKDFEAIPGLSLINPFQPPAQS
ncbi:MAG: type II toxin-antitoxin system VapC family toxin [Cyanobium sp.]